MSAKQYRPWTPHATYLLPPSPHDWLSKCQGSANRFHGWFGQSVPQFGSSGQGLIERIAEAVIVPDRQASFPRSRHPRFRDHAQAS
jgi:hypothetical protein